MGNSKAEVAAKFVEKRVRGVKITPHNNRIQDFDEDFYMQFTIVVCGLDSIEARRWINATLVNMVDEDNSDSLKPLIDGGTEGEWPLLKQWARAMTADVSFRLQGAVARDLPNRDLLHRVSA